MSTTGQRQAGFTLMEIILVVAIVAILAGLALPNFQEHLRRGKRSDARLGLLRAAHWLERAATAAGRYPVDAADFPDMLKSVPSGHYAIQFEPADAQGSGYTLTAIPQGDQAADRCGGFTLGQTGLRGLASASASDDLKAECWNR
ncbi:type IV pilin protein [Variovorax sp. J2P1-59]|uniref:type IV pilin protein n=1 Tax=Variovorax flavidus TaxID=3053501 RepID=UPI002577263B|nr:type IV pilin protein [Variovorax sp. J2P1-59]MDM0072856.1 type IV pilin protein [Variovorax sp. J2P1-59]